MDIGSIKLAYDGLKSAKDIFTAFNDLKNESDAISKVNEAVKQVAHAQDMLYNLKEELFRLQEENHELKQKVLSQEAWENRINNYKLVTTEGGAIVYKSIGGVEHFICPSCVEKKEIHPLQDAHVASGGFDCTGCNKRFPIKEYNVGDFAAGHNIR
jgi:hypothetical protein